MTTHFARSRTAAGAVLLALILFACGSDSESDTSADDPPESSEAGDDAAGDPQTDPTSDDAGSATDVPVIAVGETFTINATGTFEATYLGLADLGTAETTQSGDVQCYGILAEVTLVTEGQPGSNLSPQRAVALGADGSEVGNPASLGCSLTPLADAGFTGALGVEWTEGVTESVYLDFLAVPVGDEGLLDRVSPYPALPEFELEATVTETLV